MNQSRGNPLTAMCSNFAMRVSWLTVTIALDRSRKTPTEICLFSINLMTLLSKLVIANSVERCALIPYCDSDRTLCLLIKSIMRL